MKVKTRLKLTLSLVSKIIVHFIVTPLVIFIRNLAHFSVDCAPSCRFDPTCLSYSKQAFAEFGFLKGFVFTIKRVIKCHPLGSWGWDPIPRRDCGQ